MTLARPRATRPAQARLAEAVAPPVVKRPAPHRRGSPAPLPPVPGPSVPGLRTPDDPGPADAPAEAACLPQGSLRRCTFRRLDILEQPSRGVGSARYAVVCLAAGSDDPLPLGDLEVARPTCAACRVPNVFRPDDA